MTATENSADTPVTWPGPGLTEVPYEIFTSQDQYALENERIFKGRAWNYLCLAAEIPKPGDYVVSTIGETSIIVVRNLDGELRAMVNRCAHRGALLCLKKRGNSRKFSCVYHAWSYDLDGNLTNVAFRRGIKGEGGMGDDFKLEDHPLRPVRVAEFSGLLFGSFDADAPDIDSYIGPEIGAKIRRVLNRPTKILGRNTQILRSNWKLYMENVRDSYHASILHLFFTTFRINRLTQSGAIIIDESGGNHVSYSKIDNQESNKVYEDDGVRSADNSIRLADPGLLDVVDEFGDGITMQILSVFPGFVLQQIGNSIAIRQVLPQGTERAELVWTYLGFEGDDMKMTERRLTQNNMVGPAGYISMEDGAVTGFVQRGFSGVTEDYSLVKMGGEEAVSSGSRVTEASVRGFWKKYRGLIEGPG